MRRALAGRWVTPRRAAASAAAILAWGAAAQQADAAPVVDYGIQCTRKAEVAMERGATFLVVGTDIVQIASGEGTLPHAIRTRLNVVPGMLLFKQQLPLETSYSWAIDTNNWQAAEHRILVTQEMPDLTFQCRKIPGSALNYKFPTFSGSHRPRCLVRRENGVGRSMRDEVDAA